MPNNMEPMTIWVVLGVGLLILEIFTVSFYSIFFGIGALVTAFLVYLGVADDLTSQIVIFGLSSMVSLLFFRKRILDLFTKSSKEFKEIVDEFAKVSVEIPAQGEGKVFYRGSDWIAYQKDGKSIALNAKVVIKKIDGIKLIVESV
jgi:membrane protein implicated in regulation of membrane protease activity